ncbi:hypothetical protein [Cellvibrio polysaccharolyticus]|uniref:Beta-ketoacyl synthase N-terminal domain-containing protein n=1 Tax=Cellvibrio polysaccharolyticus TaxID=2082724 RepID=A0A928YSC4_9GAMM|nr:hypothetical protein [Cellvibrio polysaccharolyticus]MBE8715859.1 hypothetical protein [Cellvibrio polysaccharolyticus]
MIKLLSRFSSLHNIDSDEPVLPDLKALIAPWTEERIRRIDRYIELCVAGGLNCVAQQKLPAHTGVYLATRFGAITTSAKVMETIIAEGDMPKPLHFVNTLGNTACFYLTRLLKTTGHTLVISQEQFSFEAALFHALIDLQQGNIEAALVGGIDEVALPIVHQAERLGVNASGIFTEGTHWLLLEKNTAASNSDAWLQFLPAIYCNDLETLLPHVQGYASSGLSLVADFSEQERARLPDFFQEKLTTPDTNVHRHGVYSAASLIDLCERLLAEKQNGLHLVRNAEGHFFLQPITYMQAQVTP